MYPPYPKNVGKPIVLSPFNHKEIKKIKKSLPKNLIIRFYGLAGVGKGTISKTLSKTLKIPYLEASFILRTITFVFEHFNYPIDEEHVKSVFKKIHVNLETDGEINFYYTGKKIQREELKNSHIDSNVTKYSSNPIVRAYYNHFLDQLLEFGFDQPVILDSRGAVPPYLESAIKRGQDVVQYLVVCSPEVTYERYKNDKIKQIKILNPTIKEEEINKIEILKQYRTDIVARNDVDVKMMVKNKMGIVSEDSFIVDTSKTTAEETVDGILNHLYSLYLGNKKSLKSIVKSKILKKPKLKGAPNVKQTNIKKSSKPHLKLTQVNSTNQGFAPNTAYPNFPVNQRNSQNPINSR